MRHSFTNGVVVIPAYNEAARIAGVLEAVKAVVGPMEIVVVDDGSTDDTAAVAERAGATVLRLPTNQGYGVALQAGYLYAGRRGADVVVQLDADGQHDPSSIPTLLQALEKEHTDVVLGSRFLGAPTYRPPWARRIGQAFFRTLLNALTRSRYTDPTSGFQAIRGSALWFFTSDAFPYDYPDADVLLMLHRAGLHCVEVPAVFRASPPGKISMHQGWRSFYYVARMLLSLGLTLVRPPTRRHTG